MTISKVSIGGAGRVVFNMTEGLDMHGASICSGTTPPGQAPFDDNANIYNYVPMILQLDQSGF
ncbi:hypothetical protein [Acidisoma silvae]|uniref:Uncharacterized protein n=1 Tax=Acidisoma silvae TaxID=2802396 RepID=A0A964E234_9PROT|nr:hypothetical protein [Acidisoma silvae]MCB8878418.1 hypothetical protein [Acidisoma silvae]